MQFSTAKVAGVLFDVDDTLYDEMTFVRSGFLAIARTLQTRFGWSPDELLKEMLAILSRDGRGAIFDDILRQRETYSRQLVEELVSAYRLHRPTIQLFKDVAPVLGMLRTAGFKLGLVTDGDHKVQQRKVDALGLPGLVDVVVRTDELGKEFWKPHPRPFEVALAGLGLSPERTIYVGNDPAKDFEGPRQLGMGSVHIERYAERMGSCQGCLANWHGSDLYKVVQLLGLGS